MSKNDIEAAGAQPIWPLAPQSAGALALPQAWAQQPTGGGILPGDLNLATLWRIVSEWRWLILGAVAVGLAGAIVVTFLTTPLYRAEVHARGQSAHRRGRRRIQGDEADDQ